MSNDKRKQLAGTGGAFLAIGFTFFVLGISGNMAFLNIAIAFFVIGLSSIAQGKKDKAAARDTDDDKDGAP